MSALREYFARAWNVVMRRGGDRRIEEEIRTHIDLMADEYRLQGMTPREAYDKARHDFGNTSQAREEYREQWGFAWVDALWYDLSFAFRGLVRRPLLLLTAAVSIAVGAGLNMGVYSILKEILFRTSLSGIAARQQVAQISGEVSFPNYADLLRAKVFADLAAVQAATLVWRTESGTKSINAKVVSANFFEVAGVRAVHGRTFGSDDGERVVLGYGFWQRQFGGNAAILGQKMNLNGWPLVVVGVLPKEFNAPLFPLVAADLYVPIGRLMCSGLTTRSARQFDLVARLGSGVNLDRASAALRAAAGELARSYPRENSGLDRSLLLQPVSGFAMWQQMGAGRTMLMASLALYTVVGLVLLVACANVAGMLLARAEERRREIAVCAALGASRWRQVQRFAAESALIAALGCTLGAGLYVGVMRSVSHVAWLAASVDVIPPGLPVGYCSLLMMAIMLICGVGPSLTVSRMTPGPALASVSNRLSRSGAGMVRKALVVLQVTICFVLLAAASLLLRGVLTLRHADTGFEVDHTVWLKIRLPADAAGTREFDAQAFERLRRSLEQIRGVESVSCVRYLPLKFLAWRAPVRLAGRAAGANRNVDIHPVGPRYLETMRIPILLGRDLEDRDASSKPGQKIATATSVVVNEALAQQFFQRGDPIGKRLVLDEGGDDRAGRVLEVVGVARDSKLRTLNEEAHPVLYLPELHTSFVLHVSGPAAAAAHSIERFAGESEPGASVEASPMSAEVAVALLPSQVGAGLLGTLGALGLLLAMTGLYAVISYAVNRRTFEIGVRMAVGATRSNIARLVLWESAVIVGIGCTLGCGMALMITRVLTPLLPASQSTADPMVFGAVALTLAIVGGAATLVPARRAAHVDPTAALRQD